MVLEFNEGLEYKGFHFGWYKKELYRLPSFSGGKKFGLKKLDIIKVGNKKGYRLKRDKLSIDQIKEMSVKISQEFHILESKHIPD